MPRQFEEEEPSSSNSLSASVYCLLCGLLCGGFHAIIVLVCSSFVRLEEVHFTPSKIQIYQSHFLEVVEIIFNKIILNKCFVMSCRLS